MIAAGDTAALDVAIRSELRRAVLFEKLDR